MAEEAQQEQNADTIVNAGEGSEINLPAEPDPGPQPVPGGTQAREGAARAARGVAENLEGK